MNRLMAAVLAATVAAGSAALASAQAPEGNDLSVTVTYTGKGEVKKGNEIGVFLWTSPDINSSPPIAVEVIEKNGGTAVFKGLTAPVVLVAVSYDEKGMYAEPPGQAGGDLHRKAADCGDGGPADALAREGRERRENTHQVRRLQPDVKPAVHTPAARP